ncbi:MAG: DUF6285 domain-containing protein [Alphaproteobacteria bacterium]|nr:DUF6285 domain-containing protein [Alphaproteobacteria bacterium]
MRQRPGPDELERLAAAILGDDPLQDDPKDRSYAQRLAAKALAIAGHDRLHGAADRTVELRLFAAVWDAAVVNAAGADDENRIAALNRRLAAEIRAGDWDAAPGALRELLTAQVRARLARTNPKYLKSRMPEA